SKPRAPDSLFDWPHVAEPRRRPGPERHAVLMVGGASRPPSGFLSLAPYLWNAALSIGQRLVACKASTRCDALDGAPAGFAARRCASPASRVAERRRSLLEERRHALPEVRRARGEHLVAVLQRDHLLEAPRIEAHAQALLREAEAERRIAEHVARQRARRRLQVRVGYDAGDETHPLGARGVDEVPGEQQ